MRTESFIIETIGLQCVQRETIIIEIGFSFSFSIAADYFREKGK